MTETRWVILLRGVNVGGVTVRSADLRELLTDAGFENVRTVLASGNALVTHVGDADEVEQRAARALAARYARVIPVLVRTQREVSDAVERCPYPSDSTTHHAYLVLTRTDADARALEQVMAEAIAARGGDEEAVLLGNRLVYWWCPRGSTLDTAASKASTHASKAITTTTRNARTMARLAKD